MQDIVRGIPNYSKEWLHGDRILCYRFRDLVPATVDHWGDDLSNMLLEWPDTRPWRLLLDIRMKGNVVSAYALRRSYEISRLRPELPGRLALLIGNRLAAEIMSAGMRAAGNEYRQRRVFVVQAVAVSWLLA
ncbi:MAG: hypothetical protein H6672_07695 [Anaerolineaceae bacterium]|nr:hypothetical protein [Anaerolineaceae bacterium]